MKNPWSNS